MQWALRAELPLRVETPGCQVFRVWFQRETLRLRPFQVFPVCDLDTGTPLRVVPGREFSAKQKRVRRVSMGRGVSALLD
jgi:hypothetical protein